MRVSAIIQNHYPERIPNLEVMVDDLLRNGIEKENIYILADHLQPFETKAQVQRSAIHKPINWWHSVAGYILQADRVALLCDDLSLKPKSIQELKRIKNFDVIGYEGGDFADTEHPYTDSRSHTAALLEPADFIIRFYFTTPAACRRALKLYEKSKVNHDDLLLSLANTCAIAPTTEESGFYELPDHGVAYSRRPTHYQERNDLASQNRSRWV